jgi:hypothetical protein
MILYSGRSKRNIGWELVVLRKEKNFADGVSFVGMGLDILRGEYTIHTPIFHFYIEILNVTILEFSVVKVEK